MLICNQQEKIHVVRTMEVALTCVCCHHRPASSLALVPNSSSCCLMAKHVNTTVRRQVSSAVGRRMIGAFQHCGDVMVKRTVETGQMKLQTALRDIAHQVNSSVIISTVHFHSKSVMESRIVEMVLMSGIVTRESVSLGSSVVGTESAFRHPGHVISQRTAQMLLMNFPLMNIA
jgi:hypothetical protein